MFKSVQGVYRHGQVELIEPPTDIRDETPVIVTFLEQGRFDLGAHGITEAEAAELRASLSAFAEEWDSPEMRAYDDYDAAKARL